jgi:parvulin-like peptidyl-prolyl isomerase
VDAFVQGLLIVRRGRRAAAAAALVLLVGCAGSARTAPPPVQLPAPVAVPVTALPQQPRPLVGYGPEILLPDPAATDAEVAHVGDLVLRQSHAFARLLSADPKLALSAVDLLVFDVLVAQHARQFNIAVAPERVRELADQEETTLRTQLQTEFNGQVSMPDYIWRIFGMPLDTWRHTVELRVAQRLYQGYVIRYLAMREDRVVVRFMANKDRAVLEEARAKVQQGADFGTLAMRLSEDPQKRDGGLLPPFGKGFPHPVADVAVQLKAEQLSDVFARTTAGVGRFYLVYCLDRLAGRDVPFAEVAAEIDRDLAQKPLTPIETNAYTLRWRTAAEAKTDDKPPAGR